LLLNILLKFLKKVERVINRLFQKNKFKMKIVVTGAAGFIGYHLCEQFLKLGHDVVGLDNIDDNYDVNLKYARLKELGISEHKIQYNKITNSN
jgi:UDP-glucuronate 4-epimerase